MFAAGAFADSGFSKNVCGQEYTDPNINEIVRVVFQEKYQDLLKNKTNRLEEAGVITKAFVRRNTGLKFVICDNPGGYDSSPVYGTGVEFDIQLIGLLTAQARALIAGATINSSDQMVFHRSLMQTFITQGAAVNINPVQQVERDVLATGMKASQYQALLADAKFKQREQNLLLIALNFLSLHERCHFGLDHGAKIEAILKRPKASRAAARYELELAADKCAIDFINVDEEEFAASPISYFGLLMVVTTQVIVSAYAASPETSSHPSGRTRLTEAKKQVVQYVSANLNAGTERYEKYMGTIEGVSAHMTNMVDFADAMRASRSKGR